MRRGRSERCGQSTTYSVAQGYSRGYSRGTPWEDCEGCGADGALACGRRRGGGHWAAIAGELDLEELKEALKDLGCARVAEPAGGRERRV